MHYASELFGYHNSVEVDMPGFSYNPSDGSLRGEGYRAQLTPSLLRTLHAGVSNPGKILHAEDIDPESYETPDYIAPRLWQLRNLLPLERGVAIDLIETVENGFRFNDYEVLERQAHLDGNLETDGWVKRPEYTFFAGGLLYIEGKFKKLRPVHRRLLLKLESQPGIAVSRDTLTALLLHEGTMSNSLAASISTLNKTLVCGRDMEKPIESIREYGYRRKPIR